MVARDGPMSSSTTTKLILQAMWQCPCGALQSLALEQPAPPGVYHVRGPVCNAANGRYERDGELNGAPRWVHADRPEWTLGLVHSCWSLLRRGEYVYFSRVISGSAAIDFFFLIMGHFSSF